MSQEAPKPVPLGILLLALGLRRTKEGQPLPDDPLDLIPISPVSGLPPGVEKGVEDGAIDGPNREQPFIPRLKS